MSYKTAKKRETGEPAPAEATVPSPEERERPGPAEVSPVGPTETAGFMCRVEGCGSTYDSELVRNRHEERAHLIDQRAFSGQQGGWKASGGA